MKRLISIITACSALAWVACDDDTRSSSSAFNFPIDFSYACEGDGQTVAPENDESALNFNRTRMCPDLPSGHEGHLFGLVLDRLPAQLFVLQLNPASGTRRLIDADYFIPGITGISVNDAPTQLLRSADYRHFYVLSRSRAEVERIAIEGLDDGRLHYTKDSFSIPGIATTGALIGNQLYLSAQDQPALWRLDLDALDAAENPEDISPLTLPLPDKAATLQAFTQGDTDGLILTFRQRPTLLLIDQDGQTLSESGLVPACRDHLDNDGDGLTDMEDPDCLTPWDDDESDATGAPRPTPPAATAGYAGTPSCQDGFDNDGDGLTDLEDPHCQSPTDDAEAQTDWQPTDTHTPAQDGPFHPTFIDGGDAGQFIYVLDEGLGEILVFSLDNLTLERIDVHADAPTIPTFTLYPFSDPGAVERAFDALPVFRSPALKHQGRRNILLGDISLHSLSSGQLRGEFWDRLLADEAPALPFDLPESDWHPDFCDASDRSTCTPPAGDDATYFAFGATSIGTIVPIEVIRRGVPVHRLRPDLRNPARRTHQNTAPQLRLRDTILAARGEPQPGFPFIGAAQEEILEAEIPDEKPARLRRYGIWPGEEIEESLSEDWKITYEGPIPGASGLSVLSADGTLQDPNQHFCEHGVAEGDLLQFEVPTLGIDPALVHTLPLLSPIDGAECPVHPNMSQLIEFPILEVGMDTLQLDLSQGVARSQPLVLDEEETRALGLSPRACRQAVDLLNRRLGLPEQRLELGPVAPEQLPGILRYQARGAEWLAVGSLSGFLHRQYWDRSTGRCEVDTDLPLSLEARYTEDPDAVAHYESCPPTPAALEARPVGSSYPLEARLQTPSFSLVLFPGCELSDDGIVAVPSQQDTQFSFSVRGPHEPEIVSIVNARGLSKLPFLETRRQLVHLDGGARRISILQFNVEEKKVLYTFD